MSCHLVFELPPSGMLEGIHLFLTNRPHDNCFVPSADSPVSLDHCHGWHLSRVRISMVYNISNVIWSMAACARLISSYDWPLRVAQPCAAVQQSKTTPDGPVHLQIPERPAVATFLAKSQRRRDACATLFVLFHPDMSLARCIAVNPPHIRKASGDICTVGNLAAGGDNGPRPRFY